jgi:hypothetical protein
MSYAGGFESALDQAKHAAGDHDVLIAGGANAVQQYLVTGLVDEFEVHVVPFFSVPASGCSRTSVTSHSSSCAPSRRPASPTSSTRQVKRPAGDAPGAGRPTRSRHALLASIS